MKAGISICTLALGPANHRGARYEGEGGPIPGSREQGHSKPSFKVGFELKIVYFCAQA